MTRHDPAMGGAGTGVGTPGQSSPTDPYQVAPPLAEDDLARLRGLVGEEVDR